MTIIAETVLEKEHRRRCQVTLVTSNWRNGMFSFIGKGIGLVFIVGLVVVIGILMLIF